MHVLVTGGRGWIGRHTCADLERRGHTVHPFDVTDGADVRDDGWLDEHVAGCDAVIHLAGLLGTHELFDKPHAAVDVNVMGTLNVLEACRRRGASYVGIMMPQVNPSLYSATKGCGRAMAEAYHAAHGVPVSHVIAYNAYGPGQAHGSDHPQKIVPTFATSAWAGRPIPIWGDGKLYVDLVHVTDVARMLVDALDHGSCEVFDAGTGAAFTVATVAKMVQQVTGDTGIEWLDPRPGERRKRTSDDYAKGRGWELLDWRPKFDDHLLREAVESYRPHAEAQVA